MQILSPGSYQGMKSITSEGFPEHYPASHSIERAFYALCDNPEPAPQVRYVRLYVKATTASNNTVDVNVEALERFVRALADDDTVSEVRVDGPIGTLVYTKPVRIGGIDTDALAEAVAA